MTRFRSIAALSTLACAAALWCTLAGDGGARIETRGSDAGGGAAASGSDGAHSGTSALSALLRGQELEASPITPLKDSDGDLLPDMLETVLETGIGTADSDSDGRDDFVEQLEYTQAFVKDKAVAPDNDGFRVVLHSTSLPADGELLWIHLLFRMRSSLLTDLKMLTVFLDDGLQRFPLDGLLANAVEIRERFDPVQGLLIRATVRIPTTRSFKDFVRTNPIAIGSYALIHQKLYMGGVLMLHNGLEYIALNPVAKGLLSAQTINAQATASPFWSSQKRCRLQLEVLGAGRHGLWCEVKKASCEPSHKASRCTPSCDGLTGGTFIVPDGLPFILGG